MLLHVASCKLCPFFSYFLLFINIVIHGPDGGGSKLIWNAGHYPTTSHKTAIFIILSRLFSHTIYSLFSDNLQVIFSDVAFVNKMRNRFGRVQ